MKDERIVCARFEKEWLLMTGFILPPAFYKTLCSNKLSFIHVFVDVLIRPEKKGQMKCQE